MLRKLDDITNANSMRTIQKETKEQEKCKKLTDKEKVVRYLTEVSNTTKDFSLKYDINKCIEIIEGKENQDFLELKDALEEALEENENVLKINYDLIAENEYLKSQLKDMNKE